MIYVDEIQKYESGPWCHLISDSGLPELVAFAERLGLKEDWYHEGSLPHYDLRPDKRARALELGAKETDSMGVARILIEWNQRIDS